MKVLELKTFDYFFFKIRTFFRGVTIILIECSCKSKNDSLIEESQTNNSLTNKQQQMFKITKC